MAGFNESELAHRAFLIDGSRTKQGNDVIIKGGQTTNYPASGGKRIRAGTVVVKESGDGLYYLADGADGASAGDINTAAVIRSAEAPDGDWASKVLTWRVYYADGKTYGGTVTAGAADDTVAEFVTLLNANTAFGAHVVASADTELVLTTVAKGIVRLYVSMNLDTAFATDDGSSSSDEQTGTEADYRVITQDRDLIDVDGASFDSRPVSTLLAGRFDESELSNLSDEARAVLQGRGSTFE